MDKAKILATAKTELLKHHWDVYPDETPTMAQGGRGVMITGCTNCRKPIQSINQFMRHLADDALPVILRKAFEIAGQTK